MPYALCSMPYALCSMLYALFSILYALFSILYSLFSMLYALCPMPYALYPQSYPRGMASPADLKIWTIFIPRVNRDVYVFRRDHPESKQGRLRLSSGVSRKQTGKLAF